MDQYDKVLENLKAKEKIARDYQYMVETDGWKDFRSGLEKKKESLILKAMISGEPLKDYEGYLYTRSEYKAISKILDEVEKIVGSIGVLNKQIQEYEESGRNNL